MDIQLDGSSCPLFPGQIGIWSVDFCGGKKGPREELFKQGKEPTRNSTHM